MAIRAVIFDFGGVLCFYPDQARIDRVSAVAGVAPLQLWEAMWVRRLEYDAGLLEPDEYWRSVLGAAYEEAKLPELIRHEVAFWNQYDQRVFDWIAELRAAGLRTAILSNLPRVLGEALQATPGFLDPFDHVTFSYEIKSVKPGPAIYRDAIQGLALPPAEMLFLDDKPENVEGARAVGLQAELFTSLDHLSASGLPGRYGLPMPQAVQRR